MDVICQRLPFISDLAAGNELSAVGKEQVFFLVFLLLCAALFSLIQRCVALLDWPFIFVLPAIERCSSDFTARRGTLVYFFSSPVQYI